MNFLIDLYSAVAAGSLFVLEKASILDILQLIHVYLLQNAYPNIEIALRIFLTIPVTVASCERSFSTLKLVRTYLSSTMSQERLSNLAVWSTEHK